VLAAAPTPTQAASLTTAQLGRLLRRAGRQRNLFNRLLGICTTA
jgi:hypothetical protein